jgi:hypothetical protein
MRIGLTLGKRIALGISIMLLLMLVVGFSGYFGLKKVLAVSGLYQNINGFKDIVYRVQEETHQYFLSIYGGDKGVSDAHKREVMAFIEKGLDSIRNLMKNPLVDEEGKGLLIRAEKGIKDYGNTLRKYSIVEKEKKKLEAQVKKVSEDLGVWIKKGFMWIEDMNVDRKMVIAAFLAYVNKTNQKTWKRLMADLDKFGKDIDLWNKKVENSDELRAVGKNIKGNYESLKSMIERYHKRM